MDDIGSLEATGAICSSIIATTNDGCAEDINHQLFEMSHSESDGQRRSLSLDDDGGAYFEKSENIETVTRKDVANSRSPMLSSNSNDDLFYLAQRLNFDTTEEDDENEFENIQDVNTDAIGVKFMDEDVEEDNGVSLDGSSYLENRPQVNGSDLVEDGTAASFTMYNHPSLMPDQGQNVRIIEGHDSSLLDDSNHPSGAGVVSNAFSLNQVIHMPPMPSGQSNNHNCDDSCQNLYDSLDPEDGIGPYDHTDKDLDPNTSEYYSGGSLSLQAMSSQIHSNSDSSLKISGNLMTNESLHDPINMGNFHSSVNAFQVKRPFKDNLASSDNSNDMSMPNSQDGFELCEEGLLQATQLYAQPRTNASQNSDGVVVEANGMFSPDPNSDKSDVNFSIHHTKQEGKLQQHAGRHGDNQGKCVSGSLLVDMSNIRDHPGIGSSISPKDFGGVDVSRDGRQAAAGSSSSWTDLNQSSKTLRTGSVPRKRILVPCKAQTKRPAVQGSASSGINRPSGGCGTAAPVFSSALSKAGKAAQSVASSSVLVVAQGSKVPVVHDGSRHGSNADVNDTGRIYTRQYVASPPAASRASTLASLSVITNANSRVGGVGTETRYYQRVPSFNPGQDYDISPSSTSYKQDIRLQTIPSHHPQKEVVANIVAPSLEMSDRSMNSLSMCSSTSNTAIMLPQSQATTSNRFCQSYDPSIGVGMVPLLTQNRVVQQSPMTDSTQLLQHQLLQQSQQQQSENQCLHPQSLVQEHQLLVQSNHSLPSIVSPTELSHSHHSINRDGVVTQTEAKQRQSYRNLLLSEPLASSSTTSNDMFDTSVPGIEEVRKHLHSMLHTANVSINEDDQADTATDILLNQPVNKQLHFDMDSSSFIGTNGPEDMSEILENFPVFSSKMFTDMSYAGSMAHRNDSHTQGELQSLREGLEKECYRRKHCEQQILKLNAKLLETQQQLAVAVSTDKRKDLMIEQLDKQLAKVVEGWKKKEMDKDAMLKAIREEKEKADECLQRQQTMINNFELELSQTIAELKEEKEKSTATIKHLKSEVHNAKQRKEEIELKFAKSADKCDKMSAEWETLTLAQVNSEKMAQQAQKQLMQEEANWKEKESDFVDKISQMKEVNQKVINVEKVKLEEAKMKREELEVETNELKAEMKKLILDVEQLVREKESQKIEMSVMEAKFESAQRTLEADLHAQMEKEIAEQAKDYHSKLETAMKESGEKHRKQVAELHARHQGDLECQMALAGEEQRNKDQEYKEKVVEFEEKLAENRYEISNLKQSKLKLESQRMEILSKLQFMMQSQWNEAVSLLVSTPQKKGISNSFLTSQSMGLSTAPPPLHPHPAQQSHDGISNRSFGASLDLASSFSDMNLLPQEGPVSVTSVSPTRDRDKHSVGVEVTTVMMGEGGGEGAGTMKDNSNSGAWSLHSGDDGAQAWDIKKQQQLQQYHCQVPRKERENVGEDEFVRMDRVEEYVYRMAIQDSTPFSPPRAVNKPQHISSISAKEVMPSSGQVSTTICSPITASHNMSGTTTHNTKTNTNSNMISAVVHHSSIPLDFQATAIKSPKQQMSRLWNNVSPSGNLSLPELRSLPSPAQSAVSQNRMPDGTAMSSPDSRGYGTDIISHVMSPPVKQSAVTREEIMNESASETSGPLSDPASLQARYSYLSDQVDTHMNRQEELQHYIQMLLQKAPGTVECEPERDNVMPAMGFESVLESSRDLTVDLDLTETAQAFEVTHQLARLQELRERQKAKDTRLAVGCENSGVMSSQLKAEGSNPMSDNSTGHKMTRILTGQEIQEISKLVDFYRDQWEVTPDLASQSNAASHLLDVLNKTSASNLEQNTKSGQEKEIKNPHKGSGLWKKEKMISKEEFIKNRKKVGYQHADGNKSAPDIAKAGQTMYHHTITHGSKDSRKGGAGYEGVGKEGKKVSGGGSKSGSKGIWK